MKIIQTRRRKHIRRLPCAPTALHSNQIGRKSLCGFPHVSRWGKFYCYSSRFSLERQHSSNSGGVLVNTASELPKGPCAISSHSCGGMTREIGSLRTSLEARAVGDEVIDLVRPRPRRSVVVQVERREVVIHAGEAQSIQRSSLCKPPLRRRGNERWSAASVSLVFTLCTNRDNCGTADERPDTDTHLIRYDSRLTQKPTDAPRTHSQPGEISFRPTIGVWPRPVCRDFARPRID